MIAYFLAGITALATMNYEAQFSEGFLEILMRPVTSPIVPLGMVLQVINGFVLSIILFPFRRVFLERAKGGWMPLFLLLVGFTLFAPQIPGPGNLEGLIYTNIPIAVHLMSVPETLLYSFLFSIGITGWYAHDKKWMNSVSVVFVVLIALMSLLGYLDAVGALPTRR